MSKLFSLGDLTANFSMRMVNLNGEPDSVVVQELAESTTTNSKLINFNSDGSCVFMTQNNCVKPYTDNAATPTLHFDETAWNFINNNSSSILPEINQYLVTSKCYYYYDYGYGENKYEYSGKIIFPTQTNMGLNTYADAPGKGYSFFTNGASRAINETRYRLLDRRDSGFQYFVVSSGGYATVETRSEFWESYEIGAPLIFTVK